MTGASEEISGRSKSFTKVAVILGRKFFLIPDELIAVAVGMIPFRAVP